MYTDTIDYLANLAAGRVALLERNPVGSFVGYSAALGWTSAIAAYGAFIIPKVFGVQIQAGTAELALYGFAAYYFSCLVVNWWFYARRGAEIKC